MQSIPFIDTEAARRNRERIAQIHEQVAATPSIDKKEVIDVEQGSLPDESISAVLYQRKYQKRDKINDRRDEILTLWEKNNHNPTCTAKDAGISYYSLRVALKRWGIDNVIRSYKHKVEVEAKKQVEKRIPTPLEDYEPGCTLDLLKNRMCEVFRLRFEKRCVQYGDRPEVAVDAYYETLVEMDQLRHLKKMLLSWDKSLSRLPDCQHTRGARAVLKALVGLCMAIDKMAPKETA
jgi:hypothetical protein